MRSKDYLIYNYGIVVKDNYTLGTKVLDERYSPFNKNIKVVKTLGLGTYIQVDGLTQSGGIVEGIWKKTLKKILNSKTQINNCLILGLGGGSASRIVEKYWPQAKITGVDIDPVIVEMGKKYLGLEKIRVEIVIEYAYSWLVRNSKIKKYDLVLVDIYKGFDVPEIFETDKFLKLTLKLLTDEGIAIFNRLYSGEKRREAIKFANKLEKVFSKVDYFYPEANIMFICSA